MLDKLSIMHDRDGKLYGNSLIIDDNLEVQLAQGFIHSKNSGFMSFLFAKQKTWAQAVERNFSRVLAERQ